MIGIESGRRSKYADMFFKEYKISFSYNCYCRKKNNNDPKKWED